ncbi:hypothetical protein [Kutzneria kofuensis]|uniref:Peptidase inhibitor family I36 n=1 Tax=Kutzneria kofuensis TaxID=103725 RepID=A0A7W9NLR3_9PSEU|nr:hypothetical protein [Kutzneria kofuensis]MBB5897320.1 hypothetical protein [Kutzneria kofuensis]
MTKSWIPLLAAGIATLALAGTAVAAPDAPASASRCGTKFCINVKGSGLHVDSATVSTKSGNAVTGYFYLEASTGSGASFIWSPKVTAAAVTFGPIDFSGNVSLCGGESSVKSNVDHPGDGCISVHS